MHTRAEHKACQGHAWDTLKPEPRLPTPLNSGVCLDTVSWSHSERKPSQNEPVTRWG